MNSEISNKDILKASDFYFCGLLRKKILILVCTLMYVEGRIKIIMQNSKLQTS